MIGREKSKREEKKMFDFLKKNKESSNGKLRRENVNCICTLNKYPSKRCNIDFGDEAIIIEYEEEESMEIPYNKIKSCGKIVNNQFGIKEAMENKILSPDVMQSPGFLAGNFYTMTNSAVMFLYIKFEEERGSIQTFLVEYNNGIGKAIKRIELEKKGKM